MAGSGYQAHISAAICASGIAKSLFAGLSLFTVCQNVVSSMHLARTKDIPFATFTIVNMMHDGHFILYSYEMLQTTMIDNQFAYTLTPRYFKLGREVIAEVTGVLKETYALLIFSEGITQTGMGISSALGWKLTE